MRLGFIWRRWAGLAVGVLAAGCSIGGANTPPPAAETANPANLHLPTGFHATIFASGLQNSRFIAFGPGDRLYVAERDAGRILAYPQQNGKAGAPIVVASGLEAPTSLDFDGNSLYVGESTRVSRFTVGDDGKGRNRQTIISGLPTGGHNTRTVLIGLDGKLYLSIGSSCNICVEKDERRATVMVFDTDSGNGRVFARGLRNAVGLAINPWSKQIWVTNNGRDNLGDDSPPETVYALQDGGNYGWPKCHAGNIVDPDFGKAGDCSGVVAPQVKMQAHSAPLGLAFYNKTAFPVRYRGLFVAFHGSWNRSTPTGYKVVFIPLNAQGQVSGGVQDFMSGWLANGQVSARPVGLAVGPDGALYVSTDQGGTIYRVTYSA